MCNPERSSPVRTEHRPSVSERFIRDVRHGEVLGCVNRRWGNFRSITFIHGVNESQEASYTEHVPLDVLNPGGWPTIGTKKVMKTERWQKLLSFSHTRRCRGQLDTLNFIISVMCWGLRRKSVAFLLFPQKKHEEMKLRINSKKVWFVCCGIKQCDVPFSNKSYKANYQNMFFVYVSPAIDFLGGYSEIKSLEF